MLHVAEEVVKYTGEGNNYFFLTQEIIACVLNVHGHACPYGEALGWRRPLESLVGGRATQGDGVMDQLCKPPLWRGWVGGAAWPPCPPFLLGFQLRELLLTTEDLEVTLSLKGRWSKRLVQGSSWLSVSSTASRPAASQRVHRL